MMETLSLIYFLLLSTFINDNLKSSAGSGQIAQISTINSTKHLAQRGHRKKILLEKPPSIGFVQVFRNKNGTLDFKYNDIMEKSREAHQLDSLRKTEISRIEPDCAKDNGYCEIENDEIYPLAEIKLAIQNMTTNLNQLLIPEIEEENSTITRLDVPGVQTMCESQIETIYPTKAPRVRDGVYVNIVNFKTESFKQAINVEKCKNLYMPCKFFDNFPMIYKTKCVQKYSLHRLLVFDRNNIDTPLHKDVFKFPSCCVCEITTI